MLLVNDPGSWDHVYWPLDHAAWNGCTPTDLVFPFFLFVMDVSVALAILPRLEQGAAPHRLRNAALWRALRIVALGVAINALAAWWLPGRDMRWPGVLQRIGVCFAVVAALAIYTPRRAWWGAIVALLTGYAALLLWGGTLAKWDNIVDHVDGRVFGHYVWDHEVSTGRVHDPEGLLSTLPAIASSLLGLCAGVWLRARRLKLLLAAGVATVLLGALWSLWIVLWTGGWAMLALLALPLAGRRARLAAAGTAFRRQRNRRLRRFGPHAGGAAGVGLAAADLRGGFRPLDRPLGRRRAGLAGLRHRVRGVLVGHRLVDGPAAHLPEAVTVARAVRSADFPW
jgi:predicted acyltransferase